MKKVLILLLLNLLVLLAIYAYGDELKVPLDCYPRELQTRFAKHGFKLDLNGNDRTRDSWGFLENKGTDFSIITYEPMTEEEFYETIKIIRGQ